MAPARKRCIQNIMALGWRSHLLCLAAFLGIIIVVGSSLPGSPSVDARGIAGPLLSATTLEREVMDPRDAARIDWLMKELGFVEDDDLGHVRNPFGYLHGDDDPALTECFVDSPFRIDVVDDFESLSHILIVGAPGSGKSALLAWAAMSQNAPLIKYSGIDNSYLGIIQEVELPTQIFIDVEDSSRLNTTTVARLLAFFFDGEAGNRDVRFRIALPKVFKKVAKPYTTREIRWNPPSLAELLRLRLRWASEGWIQDLAQLCDEDLSREDPHVELAEKAITPRRLFELGQHLLDCRIQASSVVEPSIRLTREDWESLDSYEREHPYVEPMILPAPLTLSGKRQANLELKLSLTDDGRIGVNGRPVRIPERLKDEEIAGITVGRRVKDYGSALFECLFSGEEENRRYRELRDRRLHDGGTQSPIALHLVLPRGAPELFNVPWELLYDQDEDDFLVRKGTVEIVRHLDRRQPRREPILIEAPLRVLYVAPRPRDQDSFSHYDEEALEAVKEPRISTSGGLASPLQITRVTPPTYKTFRRIITSAEETPHVVHFDGHGSFGYLCPGCDSVRTGPECKKCNLDLTELQPQGFLFFERRDRDRIPCTDRVSADEFATLLARSDIPLVVLDACRSGQVGHMRAHSGLATRLLLAGIPGVVGILSDVQAPVTQDFIQGLYEELAPMECSTLIDAVAQGRWLLSTARFSSGEWWHLPVLYLRSDDLEGQIFEMVSEEDGLQSA